MELNSFKELLLKKAEGNDNLKTLIRYISNDILAEEIIESLEKMASHKGDKANSAITGFAGSATGADINMLHDAIGHHLSHFAAANKAQPTVSTPAVKEIAATTHAGGEQKTTHKYETQEHKMHPVAAKHLERAMHLADLAARASKHSLGKMNFDHVPTHAWEMNETSNHQRINKHGQKKYADDQQGLKRRLQGDKAERFNNYGYLLQNPHESYANKGKLRGHEGQYPFEEMKINDKHVHIDPTLEAPKSESGELQYTPHEFDSHPLFANEGKSPAWERSEDVRKDPDRDQYAKNLEQWHDSPQFGSWLDKQEALEDQNPDAYKQRGMSRSEPLLSGVKRGEPKQQAPQEEAAPAPVVPAKQEQKASAPATKKETKSEVIRRPSKKEGNELAQQLLELHRAKAKNPNDKSIDAKMNELASKLKESK